jgi:hypothetical protein
MQHTPVTNDSAPSYIYTGPIIHIGALFAHHTTHFFQTLSHRLLPDNFHFSVKGGEQRDCPGRRGRLSAISDFLCKSILYGAFVWVHRALKYQKRRFPARAVLATGAAVGICVAFRAPLAGCLFVVEEAASFFTVEHLEVRSRSDPP